LHAFVPSLFSFCYSYRAHCRLHSFPTRRSSDLMISSQVDADRMDYLQRDAYYTGTNYGKFDLDRVLHVMRPVKRGIAFEISGMQDRKSTRLNSSHVSISYAVFCLKKKSKKTN